MKELQLLIVEDDPDHYRLMENALEGVGLSVPKHFSRGEDLLAYLEQCPAVEGNGASVFCILLDLGLPGISGVDVLSRLKARADWSRIPVIVLTHFSDPEMVARCHQLGCSHFISKPLDPGEFTRAISQLGLFVSLVELPDPFRKV